MNFLKNFPAAFLMLSSLRSFDPKEEFKGKRVAIIGAADSAFKEKKGDFIDGFDIVIRVNKAPHAWDREKAEYIGSKFTHLYHSFFENNFSGGGPIDWEYFHRLGIEKVINPNNTSRGLKAHFNYYKRHLSGEKTYMLNRSRSKYYHHLLNGFIPTVGFSALMSVLNSDCKEIYITGFTFFQTPYAKGYRKKLEDMNANRKHIERQGLHDPDLELQEFIKGFKQRKKKTEVLMDAVLSEIVTQFRKIH